MKISHIRYILYYLVAVLFLFVNIYNIYPNIVRLPDYTHSFYIDFIKTPLWFILWFFLIFLFPFQRQRKFKKKLYAIFFSCLFFILFIKLIVFLL